ncbi:FOG: WD40 repeat-like protein [Pirellula staleyi DSM 6068]|uniref:FOG: WD40 repeat-like protein n=1 Tax=Pirellula staleyi (strain ATCC 27377 / DSM 6068 / ICPB 4128) TaxID=530564 RepID=D2QW73_PIRSD|nr:PQQ-binding-like beta-propeller repeat protein [Pirellula staleyi]ADB15948.1 FOG: WD40 repeat-like protein [Pirellula staleyi DSM 6068]
MPDPFKQAPSVAGAENRESSQKIPENQVSSDLSTSAPQESTQLASHTPRLWPAVVIVALLWVARIVASTVFSGTPTEFMTMLFAPMAATVVLFLWWLGLSKLAWIDRLWGIFIVVIVGAIAGQLIDKSMPLGMVMFALPVVLTIVVAWLVVTRGANSWNHRAGLALVTCLAWGYFTLLRVDGIDGHMNVDTRYRWEPTAESEFLAQQTKTASPPALPAASANAPVTLVATESDWPEFRGKNRDSRRAGVMLATDWSKSPPKQLWRQLIGPGWGSLAVVGNYVFTQDQRGENEAVICLDLATGKVRWLFEHPARFWEVVAGAGPRATPTFHEGRLYTFGGSGKLHCLEAATGAVIWSRDVAADAKATAPQWGFSSSPLVFEGVVCVFAGGSENKSLMTYDALSGEPLWSAGSGVLSYSSPHAATLHGRSQILFASELGLEAYEPKTGKLLWNHPWKLEGMARVVQPHLLPGNKILIGTGYGNGTMLIELKHDGETFTTVEGWLTKEMKPYFNDFVSRDGVLYGFDGAIFGAIDLATGDRLWKKGRYGHGQVLLVEPQGLLVVISETGDLVLLEASAEKHIELAKIRALTGKTWNHPVLVGNKLLLRNGTEVACYELATQPAELSAVSTNAEAPRSAR